MEISQLSLLINNNTRTIAIDQSFRGGFEDGEDESDEYEGKDEVVKK